MKGQNLRTLLWTVGIGALSGLLAAFLVLNLNPVFAQQQSELSQRIKSPNIQKVEEAIKQKIDLLQVKHLQILNRGNKLIAELKTNNWGLPELSFFDPEFNKERMRLAIEDFQGKKYPYLVMMDNDGNVLANLRVSTGGATFLTFYDSAKKERIRIESNPEWGSKIYLGHSDQTWCLLESNRMTSELVLVTPAGRQVIQPVIKGK